jgi:hypothetical protein
MFPGEKKISVTRTVKRQFYNSGEKRSFSIQRKRKDIFGKVSSV